MEVETLATELIFKLGVRAALSSRSRLAAVLTLGAVGAGAGRTDDNALTEQT